MSSILNSVGNAIAGLAKTGNATNPGGLVQPGFMISNFAVPGVPLISFRDYFLTSMESWITTIPLRTQYIAIFDNFPALLNTNILQQLEPMVGSKHGFDIDLAKKLLTSYPLQGIVGCIFLDGVDIPTETLTVSNAQIENNRGFIQGSILENRDPFSSNNLTLQFRETNISFTDMVMRPWVILAAHKGYVATPTLQTSIKTNITILQFSRTYQNISQVPRKVWRFYNCVPISVGSRNLSYDTEVVEKYDVPFIYDSYTVDSNLYIPIPDLLDKIGNGNIPRVSPFQS